jgi:hypothetical protein
MQNNNQVKFMLFNTLNSFTFQTNKHKILLFTVISILLGLAASLANQKGLAVMAAIMALIGAYLQCKEAIPFECHISEAMWEKVHDGFQIKFSKNQHKKHSPIAKVYMNNAGKWEEIIIAQSIDPNGDIFLGSNIPIKCKILIR